MGITDPLTRGIHIKMSGCPNGCSQHHIGNIGFYGASIKVGENTIPAYVAHIGGNYEGGEIVYGARLKVRLPAKRVPDAVERWLRKYEAEREDGEGFNAYAARVGTKAFEDAVRDLAMPVEFGLETMNEFIDWTQGAVPGRRAARASARSDEPPRAARGRSHPRHPRGRRRARAARAAVQRRQGLDRPPAPGRKAFRPGEVPFPVMHVDTGHNFPEVIRFRDRHVPDAIVASVQESIERGRVQDAPSRNQLQTTTLLDAIEQHGFDAAFGGARRDEERARAKERVFSFRDDFGQWDPRRQRPELWDLYNGRVRPGEHVRVFPLSNWTELDVWDYIREEELEIPPIYFAHEREVFERDGMLYAVSEFLPQGDDEPPFRASVRYRTVGDMTCTGAVRSEAAGLDDVIAEIAATRITERGETRADDRVSEAAMEDRKRVGYF